MIAQRPCITPRYPLVSAVRDGGVQDYSMEVPLCLQAAHELCHSDERTQDFLASHGAQVYDTSHSHPGETSSLSIQFLNGRCLSPTGQGVSLLQTESKTGSAFGPTLWRSPHHPRGS